MTKKPQRPAKKTTKKHPAKKAVVVAKPYEPTEGERTVLDAHQKRQNETPSIPSLKYGFDGNVNQLDIDHPDRDTGFCLLMEALGTPNMDFIKGVIGQLASAASGGDKIDERVLNFMLSVVADIRPQDQMEAMLASQMATVHMQIMNFAQRLNHVETIDQQNSAERAFNKLARTFTAQMEALNRYRGKGQQKMTVEHVHVHEGGQAIVGNVQGGGGEQKTGEQPRAKATDA
jgi:hypothetical protein